MAAVQSMLSAVNKMKPPQAPTPVSPIGPSPANPKLTVPTGKPADANPSMVNPGLSPANPMKAPTQGVSSVTPAPTVPPPVAPSGAPMAQGVQTVDNTGLGANVSKIDPSSDLRFQTVLPTATNRFDLASKNIQSFRDLLQPQYLEDNRAITQRAAALGRVGNQDNVSDFGGGQGFRSLDRGYADRVGTYAQQVLNKALEDQIGDEANARNEIRGERSYQDALDQSAYDRARQGVLDQNGLTNDAFSRAQALNAAGQAGNPAQFLGLLGQNAQQQAGQSSSAIADLIKNAILGGGSTPAVPQVTKNGIPISINDLIGTTA